MNNYVHTTGAPTVAPSIDKDTAWKVQKRVVFALMMRETKTMFGRHKLGYLWELINAMLQVSIFWAIRTIASFHPPGGMTTLAFLIGGFLPFFVFQQGVNRSMNAISGNRALLMYPQVFPLDLIISRILLNSAVQFLVFVLMLVIAWIMGQRTVIVNPHSVLLGFSLMVAFGFGMGSLCSALNLMWPVTGQIVPVVQRILFFTSGLFFSASTLPAQAQEVLYFNPLTHVIELVRNGFVEGYGESFIDVSYPAICAFVIVVGGLLLERYSRRYLDRV